MKPCVTPSKATKYYLHGSVITSSSEMGMISLSGLAGSYTGWLGIPDHVVGVKDVRGSNPAETIPLLCPNFAGDRREKKK